MKKALTRQLTLVQGKVSATHRTLIDGKTEGHRKHCMKGRFAGNRCRIREAPSQVDLKTGKNSACGDGSSFLSWKKENDERPREE